MLVRKPELHESSLSALISDQYGFDEEPEFVPVGGDSWNYRTARMWVSVCRDRQEGHDSTTCG